MTKTQKQGARASNSGRSRSHGRTPSRRLRAALHAIPILSLILWTAIPFLVTISVSMKTKGEVFGNYGLIPENPTFNAYRDALGNSDFRRAFLSSLIVGAGPRL